MINLTFSSPESIFIRYSFLFPELAQNLSFYPKAKKTFMNISRIFSPFSFFFQLQFLSASRFNLYHFIFALVHLPTRREFVKYFCYLAILHLKVNLILCKLLLLYVPAETFSTLVALSGSFPV